MANPTWFDETTFLNSKLEYLQGIGQTQFTNIAQVKAAIEGAGSTTFQNYATYGLAEQTDPNQYFDTTSYLVAKAAQLGGAWTANSVAVALQNAGYTNAYDHFHAFGWKEDVNPSNDFDISDYLEAKAAQLGGTWTADQVEAAFAAAGFDPIQHYLMYGASEGLEAPPVPADEQVDPNGPEGYQLTSNIDIATANLFTSMPAYTPGGNDFINTLQDEDQLTGVGENPTLDVTLGSVNDAAEYHIQPIFNGIETVNVGVTGNSGYDYRLQSDFFDGFGINFADATGLETVNLTRLTADTWVTFDDLDATVQNIGLANATRGGEVDFVYREDVLVNDDDELNVTFDRVRLSELWVWEGGDSGEDQGYGFETVNMAVNGVTNVDAFYLDGNWEESGDQTINMVVDAALEFNYFEADAADYINLEANDTVMIAADEDAVLDFFNDGISTDDLKEMIVTGDAEVTIDGLDGDEAGFIFDASALQADLNLGIEESYNAATVVFSGIGNDQIGAYMDLAADISTGAGDDLVFVEGWDYINIGTDDVPNWVWRDLGGDMLAQEGTNADNDFIIQAASITTGEGNDTVTITGDMQALTDEDTDSNVIGDVDHTSIDTGAGDDVVSVGNLESAIDWDHNVLNDGNADDLWFMAAAQISTGDGNDTVSALYLEENAMIDTGADDDVVTIDADTSSLSGGVVLAADTADSREVQADGVTVDTLGAVIDLGAGDDVLTFTNESDGNFDVLLVGNRAEIRGGDGEDVLNVDAVDSTIVVDDAAPGDAADYITGFETINLTALNAVDAQTAALTGETDNETDNVDWVSPTITLDVARVDTDLEVINLVSEEDVLLADPSSELYEPGVETGFVLDNLRPDIEVNLTAQESGTSQGNSNSGATFLYPAIGNDLDEEFDVNLTVDFEDATADDDLFVLNVTAESGEFDLDLYVLPDEDGISGSGPDTDRAIENVILNFADAGSHYIDMNDFGDEQHTEDQEDVFTSLVINSAAIAGEVLHVSDINANDITIVTPADVRLSLDDLMNTTYDQGDILAWYDTYDGLHFNTYNIQTGSGNDWLDMTTDMVDGDDTIDLGAGRNEMVIANDVVINDVLNSDEIFENIHNVQILTVAGDTWDSEHENAGTFGSNGEIDLAFMDDALATGIDTINLVALERYSWEDDGEGGLEWVGTVNDAEVNLLIDNEFTRDLAININSTNTGAELTVTNVSGVDLDIETWATSDVVTYLYFAEADIALPTANIIGDNGVGNVDLTFNLEDAGLFAIGDAVELATNADFVTEFGDVINIDLYVEDENYAQIENIVIDSSFAAEDQRLGWIFVDDQWNTDGALTIDMSGVNTADQPVDNDIFDEYWAFDYDQGGITVDASYWATEDDAVLNVIGTNNDDWIYLAGKTDVGDTVNGGGGDDVIQAGIGNDILSGGASGHDVFVFEMTGAENGRDTISEFTTGNGSNGDVLDFTNFFVQDIGGDASDYVWFNGSGYNSGVVDETFNMVTDILIIDDTDPLNLVVDGVAATAETDGLYVATNSVGNVNVDSMIVGVDNGEASATTDDVAHFFQTSSQPGSNYLNLSDDEQCVVIFGDRNTSGQEVQVFLVDDTLDTTSGYIDSTDVFLVGTVNAQDLDSFMAYNFGFYTV